VWRLQTDEGNATSIRAFEWDAAGSAGMLANLSVWETVEGLASWVYGPMHRVVLRRRGEWFQRSAEAMTALWWVPIGRRPTTDEAEARVRARRLHGPSPWAFTFRLRFGPPNRPDRTGQPGHDDWLCRA